MTNVFVVAKLLRKGIESCACDYFSTSTSTPTWSY